jgi:hypothetical protein
MYMILSRGGRVGALMACQGGILAHDGLRRWFTQRTPLGAHVMLQVYQVICNIE